MRRKFEETRKYDIFGDVKITFEFIGDINEQDFKVFIRDYLGKKETENPKMRDCPKGFARQSKEYYASKIS